MKERFFLTILTVLAISSLMIGRGFAEDSKFFSMLRDIPLMPGLTERVQDGVSFDKPEGRIVEATATSNTLKSKEIRDFYESALPQLGWVSGGKTAGGALWRRDGERLLLRLEEKKGLETLHLSLSP